MKGGTQGGSEEGHEGCLKPLLWATLGMGRKDQGGILLPQS